MTGPCAWWWGVVGAAIWVGNGTVAIIAVQKAGLSIAQALWSGLSIFVGFVWGAYVFEEPVKDLGMSFLALLLMVRSRSRSDTLAPPSTSDRRVVYQLREDARASHFCPVYDE